MTRSTLHNRNEFMVNASSLAILLVDWRAPI
jgi:hypothetical protein